MSKGKQVKLFVQALTRAAHARGRATFNTDELQRFAGDLRLEVPSFTDFLDVLNQQSYLLRSGPGGVCAGAEGEGDGDGDAVVLRTDSVSSNLGAAI